MKNEIAVIGGGNTPYGNFHFPGEGWTGPGTKLACIPRTLSAFSLPSFAGGVAGVASGLPLGLHDGFLRRLLSEFRIAGLSLGLQRGFTLSSLGKLRSG